MKLGKYGRILLRYSGTEQVIRVMVEGEDQALVDTIIQELSAFLKKKICPK